MNPITGYYLVSQQREAFARAAAAPRPNDEPRMRLRTRLHEAIAHRQARPVAQTAPVLPSAAHARTQPVGCA